MFQYLLLLFGLLKSPGQKETALLALFAYVFHRGEKKSCDDHYQQKWWRVKLRKGLFRLTNDE